MAKPVQPLDSHQQELVAVTKAAHQTLALARQTRAGEYQRRIQLAKIAADRAFEEAKVRIDSDLDYEVAKHAANLDEALIACYEADIPVIRIATDAFGNRYPGGVQELLVKLRADGRIGSRTAYQRNTADELDTGAETIFPSPVDVAGILTTATTIGDPTFTLLPVPLELVPGEPEFNVPQVRLDMDPRDPYFKQIAKNAREGTPYRFATYATLYRHPSTGEILVHESKETGNETWDHPVARWVKDHPEIVGFSFTAALDAASE